MNIITINGSARKNFNSAQMLESFIQGILAVDSSANIQLVNIYDLNFKGCRGCLGCHLKKKSVGCIVRDDAFEILKNIRKSDGFVFSSPIYFMEITAQIRALLERLFYPGKSDREIPVTAIYTMNQPREVMEKRFKHAIDVLKMFLDDTLLTDSKEIFSFQTLQWKNNSPYDFDEDFFMKRKKFHDENWKKDLKNAFEGGKNFAEFINSNKAKIFQKS